MKPAIQPRTAERYLRKLIAACVKDAPAWYSVTSEAVLGRGRSRWITYYRQACYWRMLDQGWPPREVGLAFGRDESTVREGAARFAALVAEGDYHAEFAAKLPTMNAA